MANSTWTQLVFNDFPDVGEERAQAMSRRQKSLDNGPSSQIWAVGGGKGGIGKSMLTSSLGAYLASHGCKTLLVDFDLGGANLHTWLGVPVPKVTLSDFLVSKRCKFEEIILPTNIENLSLVNGANDVLGMANLKHPQKRKLMNNIKKQPFDVVLLDLGGGTSFNTIDFFLMADVGVVVVTPEPICVENSYRFIKAAAYRQMRHLSKALPIRKMLDDVAYKEEGRKFKNPAEILNAVRATASEHGQELAEALDAFRPNIVLNTVRESKDIEVGSMFSKACKKYLGIDNDYLGHIDYDDTVWRAVRSRQPFMQHQKQCKAARAIQRVGAKLWAKLPPAAKGSLKHEQQLKAF